MADNCTNAALMVDAECFSCLSEKELLMIQVYKAAGIAGITPDAQALVIASDDFMALSLKELRMIQVYKVCQILGNT